MYHVVGIIIENQYMWEFEVGLLAERTPRYDALRKGRLCRLNESRFGVLIVIAL